MVWFINTFGTLALLIGVGIGMGGNQGPSLLSISAGVIVAQMGITNIALGSILFLLREVHGWPPKGPVE